jgi:hypothetical protein
MNESIKGRSILKKYIDSSGNIDYNRLKDESELFTILRKMEETDLSSLNKYERFAFWLNAYNLLTLKAVLDDLEVNPKWKGNLSLYSKFRFFILKKHRIAKRNVSLHYLENKILRKEFKDPRIHFAINCASLSCPVIPDTLFTGENLEEYLSKLTQNFMNSEEVTINQQNKIIYLNRIFKWYKKDFQPNLLDFISKYRDIDPKEDFKIKFLKYDWRINSQ